MGRTVWGWFDDAQDTPSEASDLGAGRGGRAGARVEARAAAQRLEAGESWPDLDLVFTDARGYQGSRAGGRQARALERDARPRDLRAPPPRAGSPAGRRAGFGDQAAQ